MASPQVEDGYTRIANELFDALCKIRISGEARQVFDVIIRKTYGFGKKEDFIALSQLCGATGLEKNTVCRAVNKLILMNLITREDNETATKYSVNKNFDTWKPLPKKRTAQVLPKKRINIPKKENASLPKKRHTIETTTKETITKETSEPSSQDIVLIIDSFKEVNPSYGKWYANTTQRAAISRLIRLHGPPRLIQVISLLPKTNKMQYMPTITTPVQLEDKWAQLEASLIKKKVEYEEKANKNKIAFS